MALLAGKLAFTALLAIAGVSVTCSGTFKPITASAFAAALNPGWNPGNTMDAMPTGASWGQPLLVNSTFTNVKNHGFKEIRLPGTRLILSELNDWIVE